jgi:hypothetical protein
MSPSRPPLIAFRLTAEEHERLEALIASDPSKPQRPPLWVKDRLRQLLAKPPAPKAEHVHDFKVLNGGIKRCSTCGEVKS